MAGISSYMEKTMQKPNAGAAAVGAPKTDYAGALSAIRGQANNEPVFKAPAAFSYDANTDPSYQAALRQAQQGAQTATNNAMVSLGSRGIGNSSVAVDRGNQIQQQAIGNVNDTIMPQLMNQAYTRYQDQNNNDYRTALANYNVGRDNVGDTQWQKTYDAGRSDQAENLAVNVGQLTGNYQSPDAVKNNAEMLANSAAYKGATPEKQQELHDRNMVLAQMLGKTYDPKTGTYSGGTTRTVAGQQLDNQVNETAYAHARDSLLDKRYQTEFDNNVKQQGFENALKIALQAHQISNDNAQLAISKQNANTSAASQGTSASRLAWEQSDKNPDNIYKTAQTNALKTKQEKPAVISQKDSTDAYSTIYQDINDTKSLAEAYSLVEANKAFLTDSDYKAAKEDARKKYEVKKSTNPYLK